MYILPLQVASGRGQAHFKRAEEEVEKKKSEVPPEHQSGRSLGHIWPLTETILKQSLTRLVRFTHLMERPTASPPLHMGDDLLFTPATRLLVRERRCTRESLPLWKGKTGNCLHFTRLKVDAYRDKEAKRLTVVYTAETVYTRNSVYTKLNDNNVVKITYYMVQE